MLLALAFLAVAVLSASAAGATLTVAVIDVGQGDPTYPLSPSSVFIRVIRLPSRSKGGQSVTSLSHPDQDHVGCLAPVLRALPAAQIHDTAVRWTWQINGRCAMMLHEDLFRDAGCFAHSILSEKAFTSTHS